MLRPVRPGTVQVALDLAFTEGDTRQRDATTTSILQGRAAQLTLGDRYTAEVRVDPA